MATTNETNVIAVDLHTKNSSKSPVWQYFGFNGGLMHAAGIPAWPNLHASTCVFVVQALLLSVFSVSLATL